MLYHLSEWLLESFNLAAPFRLTHSIAFRTIFAMLTSFLITLLIGRWVIRQLYKRKIRDVVRDYSVMSVESKKGTPTMGGILILLAMLGSVALWGDFSNPFLYYVLFPVFWFSVLGGIDDYYKIRYQNSDKGLSRKVKYLAQGGYALVFGILFLHPATSPLPHPARGGTCHKPLPKSAPVSCEKDADCWAGGGKAVGSRCWSGKCQARCTDNKGKILACKVNDCKKTCGKKSTCKGPWTLGFAGTPSSGKAVFTPSQLYIPFYKWPVFDLSWLYLVIIVLMIIYSANAVNFADGLDGLATGPTLFSYAVYAIYAYVLGNSILSNYLLFPNLPGVGEITVFCGAVGGAAMGFLWFNSYPADVFMGDMGSLMLGGVLGTIMVLLKQEVLFFLLGGIFLVEIVSVMIQDWLGIQVLGRRLLFRAPIHHTFQHRGMSEPKIVMRFWIVAAVLALLSLAALKIR
jgi:UDP-N-acetylmuramyl pentapeptide phosphotransferase/UDP-N-acetylglucosamine-1-phosphate transferase